MGEILKRKAHTGICCYFVGTIRYSRQAVEGGRRDVSEIDPQQNVKRGRMVKAPRDRLEILRQEGTPRARKVTKRAFNLQLQFPFSGKLEERSDCITSSSLTRREETFRTMGKKRMSEQPQTHQKYERSHTRDPQKVGRRPKTNGEHSLQLYLEN